VLEGAPIVVPSLAKQRTVITVASLLREEQRLLQQVTQNSENTMSVIANDLYKAHGLTP